MWEQQEVTFIPLLKKIAAITFLYLMDLICAQTNSLYEGFKNATFIDLTYKKY